MGGSEPARCRVSIGIEAELLSMDSPSACITSMTMGTESPETSAGNVTVSLETPGVSRSGVFDSMATERSPILANSRVVGNLANQFIPVARIDTVPPGRMRSGPAADPPVTKIPGLASSTLVSSRFESPDAVSTAMVKAVAGGTAGQRNST